MNKIARNSSVDILHGCSTIKGLNHVDTLELLLTLVTYIILMT